MPLEYISNYWTQKRYRACADGQWMLFIWGVQAKSMAHALYMVSNKSEACFDIHIEEDGSWRAFDHESGTRYIIEKRDTMPDLPSNASFSVRDNTIPPNFQVKQMPVPGSLFK